ncbi:MAG: SurA N-terminal domain-containing protein [Planctomycetota bacterium]
MLNKFSITNSLYFNIITIFILSSLIGEDAVSRVLWEEKIKDKIGYKGIVARVGDVPIFAEIVYNKILKSLYKIKNTADENAIIKMGKKLFENELTKIIDIEVIENYAKNKSITVSDEEVEKELKNVINKLGGLKKFKKFLRNTASTYDSFKKDLRFNILLRKVHQNIYSSNEEGFFTTNPTDNFVKPEDIRLYYENNKNEFFKPPRIQGIWIVKKYKNSSQKKEILRYMKTIINLCKQGYSFYKIHRIYSDEIQPKTFKTFPLNIFDEEIARKIENLKKKEGFHILIGAEKIYLFYIKRYIKGKQLSLLNKQVYEKIYSTLYQEKMSTLINQIKSELHKNISIKKFIDR